MRRDYNSRAKVQNVRVGSSGLGNELIAPKTTAVETAPIECRERLGGLLKFCYREAA
jgi:hypothetical protein